MSRANRVNRPPPAGQSRTPAEFGQRGSPGRPEPARRERRSWITRWDELYEELDTAWQVQQVRQLTFSVGWGRHDQPVDTPSFSGPPRPHRVLPRGVVGISVERRVVEMDLVVNIRISDRHLRHALDPRQAEMLGELTDSGRSVPEILLILQHITGGGAAERAYPYGIGAVSPEWINPRGGPRSLPTPPSRPDQPSPMQRKRKLGGD